MIEADVDENGYVPLEEVPPPIPATVFYRRPLTQVSEPLKIFSLLRRNYPYEVFNIYLGRADHLYDAAVQLSATSDLRTATTNRRPTTQINSEDQLSANSDFQ